MNKKKAIAKLRQFGFHFEKGFVRFELQDKTLDTFIFHVDEIRSVSIQKGPKHSGSTEIGFRVYVALAGQSSAHCSIRDTPENLSNLCAAFVTLRDHALGIPSAAYTFVVREVPFLY